MRSATKVTAILLSALFLAGCKTNATLEEQEPNNNYNITSVTPSTSPTVSAIPSAPPKETTSTQQYYKTLAESYVANSTPGNEFVGYYKASDYFEVYPIYGTYLDLTGDVAYLFYKDNNPYRIAILSFDENGVVKGTPLCKDMTNPPPYIDVLSIEDCYDTIVTSLTRKPDFNVYGIIRNSEQGYPQIYAVGKLQNETTIKFMRGEPCAFSLVDPFETLEAGYEAYKEFLSERETIRSRIPIYPWTEANFYSTGYLSTFKGLTQANQQNSNFAYLNDYDSWISVPLLNADLEENVYILHMLYYHNQFIGEIIIERKNDGSNITLIAAWENIAEKAADGQYIPLETSQYVNVLTSAKEETSLSIEGVVFDNGDLIPVGTHEGKLMAYNFSSNTLNEYK